MGTTIRAVALVTFAITVTGCAHVGLPSPTISTDHPATIQLSTYAGLLRSLSVTVGHATHPFIFDTGGGETLISPDLASGIGCRPYGRAIGFRMGGEQVAFEYCDDVLLRLGDISIAHDALGYSISSRFCPGTRRRPMASYRCGRFAVDQSQSISLRAKSPWKRLAVLRRGFHVCGRSR